MSRHTLDCLSDWKRLNERDMRVSLNLFSSWTRLSIVLNLYSIPYGIEVTCYSFISLSLSFSLLLLLILFSWSTTSDACLSFLVQTGNFRHHPASLFPKLIRDWNAFLSKLHLRCSVSSVTHFFFLFLAHHHLTSSSSLVLYSLCSCGFFCFLWLSFFS